MLLPTFLYTARAGHPEKNAEGFVSIFDGKDRSAIVTGGNAPIKADESLALTPLQGESCWKRCN
jgi:hypothetical protein